MSFDHLQDLIKEKKNPTVVGLDPKPEYVPPHILSASLDRYGETLEGAADAIFQFNKGLMDALADIVPAVKPQSAYYERMGWQGMRMLDETIHYAREKGLFVIADVKRGDIGSTAEAYSDAWIGRTRVGQSDCAAFDADCLTINGYMGSDSIEPFLNTCKAENKCLFALVKTSNPSSGELQDMVAGDRVVYQVMGDLVQRLGQDELGKYGYSRAGAVVGATYPSELRSLRKRLEHTFFLVPGYGAQGGTAQDVQHAFDKFGRGAIVNASRSIMCAWKKTGRDGLDYQDAARAAAESMRDDIKQYVTVL
ncbi:MAG: orotidine-5'-phosphate decarboxylase [Pseudoflavonifractor sp.]|nr:orotidine-5'-phosphate decarboxylase [Pseudoflavonifractor sp.]